MKLIFICLTGNAGNHCDFSLFQVIPYNHNDSATNFTFESSDTLQKCVLENVLVKYPNNCKEMELEYLNESHVNLNISNNTLYFKVGFKSMQHFISETIIVYTTEFLLLLSSGNDQSRSCKEL
jgi:hypothetical protein